MKTFGSSWAFPCSGDEADRRWRLLVLDAGSGVRKGSPRTPIFLSAVNRGRGIVLPSPADVPKGPPGGPETVPKPRFAQSRRNYPVLPRQGASFSSFVASRVAPRPTDRQLDCSCRDQPDFVESLLSSRNSSQSRVFSLLRSPRRPRASIPDRAGDRPRTARRSASGQAIPAPCTRDSPPRFAPSRQDADTTQTGLASDCVIAHRGYRVGHTPHTRA